MKRLLFVLAGMLMASSLVSAQVIDNFNNSVGGFKLFSGNNGLDSIASVPGPVKSSNGVLAMYFNFAAGGYANGQQHGIIADGPLSPNGAQLITYYVYLPSGENIPDSLRVDIYVQDKTNYQWEENEFYAMNIPRDKWYPLSFPLTQTAINNPKFDMSGQINVTGLQIFPTNAAWKGVIYVDNVELDGSKPYVIENFKTPGSATPGNGSVDGYYINTQYSSATTIDSIFQAPSVTDSNGVTKDALGVGVNIDSTIGGMWIGWNNFAESSASNVALAMWVYIPPSDTFPSDSSVSMQLIYQPHSTYNWNQVNNLQDLVPVGKWYPVYFPIADSAVTNAADSLSGTNDLWNFGIQIYSSDSTTSFNGKFYISDVELIGSYVASPVWLAADFKSKGAGIINGLNGFKIPSFATTGTIKAYSDLVHGGLYTMEGKMDLSRATPLFAAVRDSVPMADTSGDLATGASINVFLPSGMPDNGVVKLYVSGGANDSAGVADTIGSQIMPGSFTKLMVSGLDSLAGAGMFDRTKPAAIGLEIYYPGAYDTTMWSGSIEVDSVKVYGISFPYRLPDENNTTTGIASAGNGLPKVFRLYNNYPNPFNPSTVIQYALPRAARVTIKVYDVLGREVATLVNDREAPGLHKIHFNMDRYASGVYFVRMRAGKYIHVQKMMLLK